MIFTEKKLCFTQFIQYKKSCLAVSDLFHMFTQSIKFYTFHYHVLKSTNVWKMDTSKTWTRTLKNLDPEKPGP